MKRKFAEFYASPSTQIPAPATLEQRELAFLLFKEKMMVRHRSANNVNGLKRLVCDMEPSDVYY